MARVLLLPGLASDEALWRDQVRALREHGHEPVVGTAHMRARTLPEMADLLLTEHPGPLVLAGTSMGGMLALEVFRRAPARVAALALLGCSPRPETPEVRSLREQAIALFEAGRMEEVLRANVAFVFHSRHQEDPRLVADYLEMVGRAGARALITQNRAIMARPDNRPLLSRIACPVLIACGDADVLTPPACSLEMADAIAHARFALLPQCGHLLTWECPQEVNALLLQWLEGVQPAAGQAAQQGSLASITPPPRHTAPS